VALAELNNRFYAGKTSLETEELLACLEELEAIEVRALHAYDMFASDPAGQARNLARSLDEAATQMSEMPRSTSTRI